MKNKTTFITIILLVIFINISLWCKNTTFINLQPKRMVTIEEIDSVFIKDIQSFAVSPDGKRIAFIDGSRLYLSINSSEDGSLLNYFQSSDTLSNFFVENSGLQQAHNNMLYVINDELEKIGLNRNYLSNDFEKIIFISDTMLLASGTMRAFAIDTHTHKALLDNIAGHYLFNDKLKLITASPFEARTGEYSVCDVVYPYHDSLYIVTTSGRSNPQSESIDSLPAFSLFNSDGENLKLISYLPKDYSKDSLCYRVFSQPLMCRVGNKIFFTAIKDYKIRDLFGKDDFLIQGFDSTNIYTWAEMLKKSNEPHKIDFLNTKKPMRIHLELLNLGAWGDSAIGVHLYQDNDYIQIYSINGQLLSSYLISPPQNHSILHIAFDPQRKRIFAITSDEQNYYLIEYKVE